MATIEPNLAYRRYPWLAERAVRKDPDARYRAVLKTAKVTVPLNAVFLPLTILAGQPVWVPVIVLSMIDAGHRWRRLVVDPDLFSQRDGRLRACVDAYRAQVSAGTWRGWGPVPLRLLLAPAAGLQLTQIVWSTAHPGALPSIMGGVAFGVLWFVAALLSIELGIATEPTTPDA